MTQEEAKRSAGANSVSLWFFVLFVIGVIYFVYYNVDHHNDSSSQPESVSEEDISTAASVECQDYVRNQLKAPATADFALPVETQRNGNTFRIASYVDAENGFGAKIRSNYDCVVQWNGQKIDHSQNWNLLSLIVK